MDTIEDSYEYIYICICICAGQVLASGQGFLDCGSAKSAEHVDLDKIRERLKLGSYWSLPTRRDSMARLAVDIRPSPRLTASATTPRHVDASGETDSAEDGNESSSCDGGDDQGEGVEGAGIMNQT